MLNIQRVYKILVQSLKDESLTNFIWKSSDEPEPATTITWRFVNFAVVYKNGLKVKPALEICNVMCTVRLLQIVITKLEKISYFSRPKLFWNSPYFLCNSHFKGEVRTLKIEADVLNKIKDGKWIPTRKLLAN